MIATGLILFLLLVSAKALVVLAVALGLTHLMRERSAAERHLVWVLAAACVLALPVLTLAGPSWQVRMPVLPDWAQAAPAEADAVADADALVIVHAHARAAPVVVREVRRERISRALGTPTIAPDPKPAAAPPAAPKAEVEVVPAPTARASTGDVLRSALPWAVLLLVWAIGFVIVAGRVVAGLVGVARLTRRARPLLDAALLVRIHGIAAEIGMRRPLRLIEGDATAMPMTFGIVRPGLLLPSSARSWSGARQDAVLRHELEHVRRWDTLSQLIAQLGCALYWFNPLMWRAERALCTEREHACDDAVVAAGSRPTDYASELLEIARALRPERRAAVAAIAMARTPGVRRRVESLLDTRRRRAPASTSLRIPAWIGAFALITPLSSLVPQLDQRLAAQRAVSTEAAAPTVEVRSPANGKAQAEADHDPAKPVLTPALWPSSLAAHMLPLPDQEDCLSSGKGTNVNSNTNDSRRTIKWSGDGCSGEVLIEGTVTFDPTFTTITGISSGGRVRITTAERNEERSVTITPAAGGVAYAYTVDGSRRELDAAGRQWLSSSLLLLFRRFGFMAEERATSILQRGGADAVLSEVGFLRGDYVRAKYLTVLVERGHLDARALDRVLRLAGSTMDSDHYRTQIITAAAGRYEFDDAVRSAYLHAVEGIDSDHYKHQALSTLLEKGRLSPAQTAAVLRASSSIDSDHYRARVLDGMAPSYRSTPAIRDAWLDAARTIGSDHYKAEVIMHLLDTQRLDGADLESALSAAGTIESDSYLRKVLGSVASRERLEQSSLRALLAATGRIESDHYRSEVLIDVARRHRLDGPARAQFDELVSGIGSRVYRNRVTQAIGAQGG